MTDALDRARSALADRYRIERELGSGGMATVYLAEDLKHHRKVAVKVLRPELAAVLGGERFVQEITTTANLQHPHILPLFDSGEADGLLYYVMPFIDGETLRDKLNRETQLGIEEAVKITTEVAGALNYAHGQNVIHRDIKPENILLQDGRPMVADFGIALAVSAAAGNRMTETGLSLGTPHYMSPEQATAEKDLTNRSDIYSLGAVLYEMLTGEPPHMGNSAQQIIMKIVTDEARPVTELRKSVPPNVAAVVAKALEKLPADRFENAVKLAEGLHEATFASRNAPVSVGRGAFTLGGSPPWKVLLAAVGVALVAGGGAGWILRPIPETPPRPVQFAIESDSMHRIVPSSVALSPDGAVLVYTARSDSGSMLYRRRIDELEVHPIAGTEGGFYPFFSPDGAQLGFRVAAALRRVRLDGGTPSTITEFEGHFFGGVDWGDDDEIVFSTLGPNQVYTVSANGGTPELLDVLNQLVDTLSIEDPAFIPGARALLFTAFRGTRRIGVASLESGSVHWLMPGTEPRYVQSGHLVYIAGGSLLAQPFDVAKLDTVGPAYRLLEGMGSTVDGPIFAVSASGTFAYSLASNVLRDLVLVDRDGTEQLLLSSQNFWIPRFSPDGTRIAFGVNDQGDIWIHDLAVGNTVRITFDGQRNHDPVWNPDGTSLAFSGSDAKDLYVVPADGGEPDLALAQDGEQWTTDWSPDGRYLVFTDAAESEDIWVAPLSGDAEPRPFLATDYNEGSARISPNGRWLAYHSNESGQLEVYVQTFPEPGGKRMISTGGGEDPIWGPNGRELFYWDSRPQLIAVQLTTDAGVEVGRRDVLFRFPGYLQMLNAQYDVHPDGQRFVIVRSQMRSRLIVALDLIHQRP